MNSGYVYILHKTIPLGFDHYKIGKAKRNVAGRLRAARTGSSHPVELQAAYAVRNRHSAEAMLHRLFDAKRVQHGSRNEWFRLSAFDLFVIRILMALR